MRRRKQEVVERPPEPVYPVRVVGFTGSRYGMSDKQWTKLTHWLDGTGQVLFIHGCCKGADVQAVEIVLSYYSRERRHIRGLPGDNLDWTSAEAMELSDDVDPVRPNLARNSLIVKMCEVLLAAPNTMSEQLRGGTWFTIRKALSLNRPVVIFYPDGTTECYGDYTIRLFQGV